MKFFNHLAGKLYKLDSTLLHSHQQRYSFANSSKFLDSKRNHPQFDACYGNSYFFSRIRVPHSTLRYPMLGSFVQRSSFSSKIEGKGLLSWYLNMLESYPIMTKCVSASIIYAAADFTSQMITMTPSGSLDSTRTLRMAVFGLFILGLMQHNWFNFIAKVLPKTDVVTTLKKIAMGQLIFGPIITSSFFSFNALLQGENGGEIAARLKRDLLPTCLNGLIFWPVCDFFTYRLVPVHLQPLANSSFAYLWTIYLTYMASLEKPSSD